MVMRWRPLAGGPLGASASADANLAWGDVSAWRDFRRPDEPLPRLLPMVFELMPGNARRFAAAVRGSGGRFPNAYDSDDVTFCSALLSPEHARVLLRGDDAGVVVRRMAAQLPLVPLRPRPRPDGPKGRRKLSPEITAGELLLGVIDSGCPFAQTAYRQTTAGPGRIRNLWIQDRSYGAAAERLGGRPSGFGYGLHLGGDALDAMVRARSDNGQVDEAAVYRDAGIDVLARRFAHGASVLDLFAGDTRIGEGRDPARGGLGANESDASAARRAPIAFVQLPRDIVQDSSSAGLARYLIDGLNYIVSCAGSRTKRIVVNLSDGSSRGTHDGRSIFELALLDLIRAQAGKGRELRVTLAAGNSFHEARHAVVEELPSSAARGVVLRLPCGSQAPAQVVVRIPASASGLEIAIVPPLQQDPEAHTHFVARGEIAGWTNADGGVAAAIVHPRPGAAGTDAIEALVTFAPTTRLDGDGPVAPAGDWVIVFRSPRPVSDPVHLYVPRSQRNTAAVPRSLQARFVDCSEGGAYDPHRHLRTLEVDPGRPQSPIRRNGTLSSLATLPQTAAVHVVGSSFLRKAPDRQPPKALYSSTGPAVASGLDPARPGPDVLMPTEVSRATRGIRTVGVLSGQRVRVSGTSFAAPQWARRLAD
jgi:hypothetical protein